LQHNARLTMLLILSLRTYLLTYLDTQVLRLRNESKQGFYQRHNKLENETESQQ